MLLGLDIYTPYTLPYSLLQVTFLRNAG